MSALGQKAKYSLRADVVRSAPNSRHETTAAACRLSAKRRRPIGDPGTYVPVEEPSTASIADIASLNPNCGSSWGGHRPPLRVAVACP
jgi:hypothetical protein